MRLTGGGIIIDKDKRILLTKRSNYTKMFPHHWTIPSGRGEEGESPEQVAKREVFEEVGLDFEPTKLFMDCIIEHSGTQVHAHRYLGNWSGKVNIQEEEADGFAWYTYEETKKLDIAFNYREMIEKLYEEGIIS